MSAKIITLMFSEDDPRTVVGWLHEKLSENAKGFSLVTYCADGTMQINHFGDTNLANMSMAGFTLQRQAHEWSMTTTPKEE